MDRVTWSSAKVFSIFSLHVPDYVEGTVYMDQGSAKYVAGSMNKTGAAYGYFNNTMMQTGWGTLELKAGHVDNSTKSSKNTDYMYAAGYLEGIFTAKYSWSALLIQQLY